MEENKVAWCAAISLIWHKRGIRDSLPQSRRFSSNRAPQISQKVPEIFRKGIPLRQDYLSSKGRNFLMKNNIKSIAETAREVRYTKKQTEAKP